MVALQVVIMTTWSATSEDKVVIMITAGFLVLQEIKINSLVQNQIW